MKKQSENIFFLRISNSKNSLLYFPSYTFHLQLQLFSTLTSNSLPVPNRKCVTLILQFHYLFSGVEQHILSYHHFAVWTDIAKEVIQDSQRPQTAPRINFLLRLPSISADGTFDSTLSCKRVARVFRTTVNIHADRTPARYLVCHCAIQHCCLYT